jgi:endonuclease/exonuclease/phosphatase family metal-dependent hydrolase
MNFSPDQKTQEVDADSIKSSPFINHNSEFGLTLFSSLLFLFFIQQITFLIESIYMLNLLHTSMDSKALGILFLALPVLLFVTKHNKTTYFTIISSMLLCMFLSPLLPTPLRIFSSGIGAGLFLLFLGLQLSDSSVWKINWGQSTALATLISILFRIAGHTLDVSITGSTKFIGWILLLITGLLLYQILKNYQKQEDVQFKAKNDPDKKSSWLSTWACSRGLAGSFIFIYFVFSSPGVLTRWTEGDYTIIHMVLPIFILILVFFGIRKIFSIKRPQLVLAVWNGIFLLFFVWNILLHRINFPSLQNMEPVVVGESTTFITLINYVMLVLSPIIFINIAWFAHFIKPINPQKLGIPFLRMAGLIIICVFMLIFTNTWGYMGSLSKLFRNQFHIPFVIAGIYLILPYVFTKGVFNVNKLSFSSEKPNKILAVILVIVTCGFVILGNKKLIDLKTDNVNELTLMTYNIQQGVDYFGNKNFEGQLATINEVNPDIICLQESDASRISGGNSDVVRYFAEHLSFYTYYGPKTVAGTFGTAILSRYPLDSCRTVFTYSDKDEIGTAVAVITIGGQHITLINSHPAGKEKAKHAHIDMVSALAKGQESVIAMGDYNFRQDSPYYQKITTVLSDAWLSLYPDAIGIVKTDKLIPSFDNRKRSSGLLLENGKLDMKERIDHIFLSKNFEVVEAHFLPAPESETDHPVHWAVVRLE